MTIANAVIDYFKSCPLLADGVINLNYLHPEPVAYTIETGSESTTVQTYIDGSAIMKLDFAFCSRCYNGSDALQNIAASGFYEELAEWVENNNRNRILPELPGNRQSIALELFTHGYVVKDDHSVQEAARYQIQCRLTYYKEI